MTQMREGKGIKSMYVVGWKRPAVLHGLARARLHGFGELGIKPEDMKGVEEQ